MSRKTVSLFLATAGLTLSAGAVSMDMVTVGNAGNLVDPLTGYGAVGYTYQIGKYEVTNTQYAEFLNATASVSDPYSLYSSTITGIDRTSNGAGYLYTVTAGYESVALNPVSWFDAARFCNWMANGQGSGSTETGSYTLNGAMSGIFLANVGAQVYLPSEDEWYKAAYYNGSTQTYSLYANGQGTISSADANYGNGIGHVITVGSYPGDASYYGTYDQTGNAWEWNDALVYNNTLRGLRGGSYSTSAANSASTYRSANTPNQDTGGFRIVYAVPEPSSLVLSMLVGMPLISRRKR